MEKETIYFNDYHKSYIERGEIARAQNSTSESLSKLLDTEKEVSVLKDIAENPNSNEEVILKLLSIIEDKTQLTEFNSEISGTDIEARVGDIYQIIGQSESITLSVAEMMLGKDESGDRALAENSKTPVSVLEKLVTRTKHHPMYDAVIDAAEKTLNNLENK